MEFFGKTRKVGSSVVVTVPKSTNIREEKDVHVVIKEIPKPIIQNLESGDI